MLRKKSKWLDEKFELESKVREIEAEVGPIKYIAELIYGETNPSIIDCSKMVDYCLYFCV